MKHLYYTLYLFYKKVIRIESWGDTPFWYCTIVLALFQIFLLFGIINIYLLNFNNGNKIDYSEFLPFTIGMIFFLINRFYFRPREKKILVDMSSKSKASINITIILSIIVFVLIAKFYFYTGDLVRDFNMNVVKY